MSPATVFLPLRAALIAHLAADPALAGVQVGKATARPLPQDVLAGVTVRMPDTQAIHAVIPTSDWHTTFLVECAARSQPAGLDADAHADQLLAAVCTRLHSFAITPAGQALAVIDVQDESIAWEDVAHDVPYSAAILTVVVQHRTPAHSLQPWGTP